jgi:hypothetical protein
MKKLSNSQATKAAFRDMPRAGMKLTKKDLIRYENDMLRLIEDERELLPMYDEFCIS